MKSEIMNKLLIRWLLIRWHGWRFNALSRKLNVQETRCNLLAVEAHASGSIYHTDQMHESICKKLEIMGKLSYQRNRLKALSHEW